MSQTSAQPNEAIQATIPASWGLLLRGRNGLLSMALAGGVILHAINVYITITILPSVVDEIGGGAFYAWNTTLFILASIIGSALSASLLARLHPRKSYRVATAIFLCGTSFCAVAPSMPWLLAGRTVQGLGGGFLFSLSYALIRLVFSEKLWPRAMALVSSMWGVATLAGPSLGGVFAEMNAWRSAFCALLIVGLFYAILTEWVLPKASRQSVDPEPVAWWHIVLLGVLVLIISLGSLSSNSLLHMSCIALALLVGFAFIRLESTGQRRLLPSGALGGGSALMHLYLILALIVISTQTEIYIPYFLQTIHDISPLASGYMAAAIAAGWAVAAILCAGWEGRKAELTLLYGPLVVTISLVGLAWLIPMPFSSWTAMALIFTALIITGGGVGLTWPHLLARIMRHSTGEESGKASSCITTVQLFATALGASLAGMVVNRQMLPSDAGIANIHAAAFWLFLAFATAPAFAVCIALKSKVGEFRTPAERSPRS